MGRKFLRSAILVLCACRMLCAGEELENYRGLAQQEIRKRQLSEEKRRAAHTELDAGQFERAVALAKEARELQAELPKLKAQGNQLLAKLIPKLIEELDAEDYEVRQRASTALAEIGPPAFSHLLKLRTCIKSPESTTRVNALLGPVAIDEQGWVRQWAAEASASSEYTNEGWSARQATGAPDTQAAGDAQTAWAAKEQNGGEEWLRLKFRMPVKIARVRIHETWNPGAVVALEVIGADGARQKVWEGVDPGGVAPCWFEVELKIPVVAQEIVIILDTKKTADWEEIDAVELIGKLVE